MGGYIARNQYGAFCTVCGERMTQEEEDWDECDYCGGEEPDDEDQSDDEP